MLYKTLTFTKKNHVAAVTLKRPTMNQEMPQELVMSATALVGMMIFMSSR
jgi:hypothetical protein